METQWWEAVLVIMSPILALMAFVVVMELLDIFDTWLNREGE